MSTLKLGVSTDTLVEALAAELREQAVQAAEPLIQQAIADFEQRIRADMLLASSTIVERYYSMERFGDTVHIRVDFGQPRRSIP